MAAGSGVPEDVIHDTRPATDRGDDDVPVDGLGDVRGLVAHRVVIPAQRAQRAAAQAEGDRDHEQRGEPAVFLGELVEAELGWADPAGCVGQVVADVGDLCVFAWPVAAG
jgi:hypothetical protein